MITRAEQKTARERAAQMIGQSGLRITEEEANKIEVVDFGLSHVEGQIRMTKIQMIQTS
jgi:hypothetical protein